MIEMTAIKDDPVNATIKNNTANLENLNKHVRRLHKMSKSVPDTQPKLLPAYWKRVQKEACKA